MKTKEELRKQIETEYDWWNTEHTHKPNVAYVKIKWFDNDEPEENVETIALDGENYNEENAVNGDSHVVPYIADEDAIAYVSEIEDFLNLVEEDNNDFDFQVVEFIGFERLKENDR